MRLARMCLLLSALTAICWGHTFKLSPAYWRDGQPTGFTLQVRLNDGAPLRLLLDTGASSLMISRRAAAKQGLKAITESTISGFGEQATRASQTAMAGRVTIGEFSVQDVMVEITDYEIADDVDGFIGTALFRDFRLRLHGPKRTLELLPRGQPAMQAAGEAHPFRQVDHLILVPVRVNGRQQGDFLVDSGASFSAVDQRWMIGSLRPVFLRGVGGRIPEALRVNPVHLELAGRTVWERDVVAMDMRTMSEQHGIPISGLIGFPTLRNSILTIDYREGLLHLSTR